MDKVTKEKLGHFDKGIIEKRGVYLHTPQEFAKKNLLHVLWSAELTCKVPYKLNRNHMSAYKGIYLLLYILEGEMIIDYKNKIYVATKGDVVFLYSGIPNRYWTNDTVKFKFVHFSGELANSYYNLLTQQTGPHFPDYRNTAIYFTAILEELETENPSDHKLSVYLLTIISSLTKNEITMHPSIKKAKNYIDIYFQQSIPIEELANYAGLSLYHFSRLFKKELSVTPHQYVINVRIKYAKQLLMDTSTSIEEIGDTCGFSNASHFIDCFKKNVEMTPNSFRMLFL